MNVNLNSQIVEKETKNYGFFKDPFDQDDLVFGSVFSPVPKITIQENGQWDEFLPIEEYQNMNGVETYACTVFGTLSAIEILLKRLYNI